MSRIDEVFCETITVFAGMVLLQHAAIGEDRGFAGINLISDIIPDETAHRGHLDQHIRRRWITEVVLLPHQVNPQYGIQQVRGAAVFGASPWVVGLDEIDQRFPGQNSLNLKKKSLPLDTFPRDPLLLFTADPVYGAVVA